MTEIVEFNKRKEYNQIQKTVSELKALCKKANIPFFFAACVENGKTASAYELEMLSASVCDTKLANDWLCRFVDITLGFDAVAPAAAVELDADEIFS